MRHRLPPDPNSNSNANPKRFAPLQPVLRGTADSPPDRPEHSHVSLKAHRRNGAFLRYCLGVAVLGSVSGFFVTLHYTRWVYAKEFGVQASAWREAEIADDFGADGDDIGRFEQDGRSGQVDKKGHCTRMELSRVSQGNIVEGLPKDGIDVDSADSCMRSCEQAVDCHAFTFDALDDRCLLYVAATTERPIVIDQGKAWFTSGLCSIAGEQNEATVRIDRYTRDASWWLRWSARRIYHLEYRYKSYTGHWKERKDYKVQVRAALEATNLTEPARRSERTATGHEWDVLWGLQWKSLKDFKRARLKSDQMINMLPGAARLVVGDKDAFHRTFRKIAERHGRDAVSHFILKSFEVEERWEPTDISDADVWIVKEFRSWNGAGVKVMSSDNVKKLIESADKPRKKKHGFIVQQYVINPLTVRGHKFDTRWWAIVTSVDPLRAYIVPNAHLKIAKSSTYDPSHQYLSDACMHITNTQVQTGCGTKLRQGQPFPTSILDPLLPAQLGDALGKPLGGFFSIDSIVKRTKRVIAESLVMITPELLSCKQKATVARTFQLFAYDIIYDDIRANAWIEEINTNGYLGGGIGKVDRRRNYLQEMLQLVGVNGFHRWEYGARVERAVRDGYFGKKLSKQEKLSIQDTVDEFAHRGHWDVLFPPLTQEELAPFKHIMTAEEVAQAEIQIWGRQLYEQGSS